jgi:predicted  nucleic acid-binding Zn-ribbon protein
MPLQTEQLLRLQDLDLRLDAGLRERAALDDASGLKRQFDTLEASLADAKARLHTLQADQVNAELEEKTIEEKRAAVTKKLYEGKVTNPKELSAMEQEIEMFGRQRGRLDERILLLMDEIETTTAGVEQLQVERDTAEAVWEEQAALYKQELARINQELARLVPQRKAVQAEIDPKMLQRYEELRRRSGNLAAVRVQDGRCAGCRTSIPAVTLREVNEQERYVYCENCHRLLFPAAQ